MGLSTKSLDLLTGKLNDVSEPKHLYKKIDQIQIHNLVYLAVDIALLSSTDYREAHNLV